MSELQKELDGLRVSLQDALQKIQFDTLKTELERLDAEAARPDLWQDSTRATEVMKEQSKLQARIEPWQKLKSQLEDVREIAALNDESLQEDLKKQFDALKRDFDGLKRELKYSGPYDDHDAILSIHAGAGGTDAQDWASMLLRMYLRWAEENGYGVMTVDESAGDEAGIKSVTIELSGSFAYGKLKGEHGVHRLVRLSPFNSDNLRQTSFAKVEVMPRIDKPAELEIEDKDLRIDVYRSGGKGGQSVNTTDSAVRITHLPTGIAIAIQNERSQLQNKETALTILRSRLAQLQIEQHAQQVADLKGPNQSAEWGNQIRSYVLHPYTMVKDLRTRHETSDAAGVLDGKLDGFIDAYLESTLTA